MGERSRCSLPLHPAADRWPPWWSPSAGWPVAHGYRAGRRCRAGRDVGGLVEAGLAQLPAAWLVVGLAALLYAVRSGWSVAAWGLLGLFLVLGQIGGLLELPGWVTGCRRSSTCRRCRSSGSSPLPSLALAAIAAGCRVAAWWRYRSRDIG